MPYAPDNNVVIKTISKRTDNVEFTSKNLIKWYNMESLDYMYGSTRKDGKDIYIKCTKHFHYKDDEHTGEIEVLHIPYSYCSRYMKYFYNDLCEFYNKISHGGIPNLIFTGKPIEIFNVGLFGMDLLAYNGRYVLEYWVEDSDDYQYVTILYPMLTKIIATIIENISKQNMIDMRGDVKLPQLMSLSRNQEYWLSLTGQEEWIMNEISIKEAEYLEYLREHIHNVHTVYSNTLDRLLQRYDSCTDEQRDMISSLSAIEPDIVEHDASKYSDEEFDAYRQKFYPITEPISDEDEKAFDEAWRHHYKNNTHHWEYWKNEDGSLRDMPMNHVWHMWCDWAAMSLKFGGTAESWYRKQTDIELSDTSKAILEKIFELVR